MVYKWCINDYEAECIYLISDVLVKPLDQYDSQAACIVLWVQISLQLPM